MTCIVGLVANGCTYIGGDSAGVSGWDLMVRADEKVFVRGDFALGFTSSFRMGQLLRWKFTPPEHPADMPDEHYMCTLFVDAVRECLKNGGYAKKENEVEQGGVFLVGYRGTIWEVQQDYQVARSAVGFGAVGCGSSYAIGALHVLNGTDPEQKVRLALETAEAFSAGVRGPFKIVRTP